MANSDANVLQTVIQLRRGTEEQWELVKDTFIPREGEPCTTIYDDGRDALIKIGDGKHTWGQLGYIKDSFFITVSRSDSGELVSDKTYEEILKAFKQNKMVYVKTIEIYRGTTYTTFFPLLSFEGEGGKYPEFVFGQIMRNGFSTVYAFQQDGTISLLTQEYLATYGVIAGAEEPISQNFDANYRQILNLRDSEDLKSAVTKRYTDNSTPTFIYLEEQNDVIQSKTTDLDTLKTALMSQTNGYTQTNKPLYKAVKCYAVLNGNCYDLIYSSKETQGAGKKDIVKRTFYAITTDGLNKLSVLIDENDNVTWTKEVQQRPMVVTFTTTDPTTNPIQVKADTPYVDIVEAANAGRIIYAFVPGPSGGPLFGQLTDARSALVFTAYSNAGVQMVITMHSDSSIFIDEVIQLYRQDESFGGGDFNAGNYKITNVKEPTALNDVATKGYVDNILTAGNSDSVVIQSSTPHSIKKFRITVDDAGAISATEVVS